ncbi:WD40-repeat-containing domain protein [Schizophyllum amplum]|uniref:WD40-repeat-containing domain protein n=1 Tax=Schizophyllum amplum TaxID=97359 RepID=A0A550CD30_9AGAR|nr:WD40-repeat-containing domain protein [Auriculariopsis ampla]
MSVVLVTGSYDHEIRFWEAWSGICSRTISRAGESGQVNRLAISPDKQFLAAAIHKKVNIYEIASTSNEPVVTFEGHTMNVTSVCFHSEGKWLVTGSEDGTIKIWDLRGSIKQWDLSENLCSHELTPAGDIPIRSVTLASDGSLLVAGNNKARFSRTLVNDDARMPRFQAVTKFVAHNKYLTRCLLSPDAKYLATCSADTTVKIWSISPSYEFRQEKVLVGHQRWVWDCAFSADSAYLVTASSDHTARLWEMASGKTVRQYNGHHKGGRDITPRKTYELTPDPSGCLLRIT